MSGSALLPLFVPELCVLDGVPGVVVAEPDEPVCPVLWSVVLEGVIVLLLPDEVPEVAVPVVSVELVLLGVVVVLGVVL